MSKALDPLTAAAREAAANRESRYPCAVPGCKAFNPFARPGMCTEHLYLLPLELHRILWDEYRLGQERGKVEPTAKYEAALEEALAIVAEKAAIQVDP